MEPAETLTSDQARVAALRASGLGRAPGRGVGRAVGRGDLARVMASLGAVQIDSVNVVARAHLMPFYSRLGPYDVQVLDRALNRRPLVAVEYWAHEASLVHPPLIRPLRWRMARAEHEAWGNMSSVARRRPDLLDAIVALLARRPMTAVELRALLEPDGPRRTDHWGWNWSEVKAAVEYLFWAGRVTSAGRTRQFERRYALPGHVWPAGALDGPAPATEEAVDVLVDAAAAACGVATLTDLRDHFRLPVDVVPPAVDRLVAAGRLVPAAVRGWDVPAFRHALARVPSPRAARAGLAATALVSPFDPIMWHRPRTERLFGFTYRIEIYTPKEKRVHGYYVLPFLLRGRLVARVDLKADRAAGVLRVLAAWAEAGAPDDTAAELAGELARFAGWLGLGRVSVAGPGDLAPALIEAVAVSGGRSGPVASVPEAGGTTEGRRP